jgi:hypothetical protein
MRLRADHTTAFFFTACFVLITFFDTAPIDTVCAASPDADLDIFFIHYTINKFPRLFDLDSKSAATEEMTVDLTGIGRGDEQRLSWVINSPHWVP